MQESRHQIKSRMLRNAARAWGYPETEAENNFDPLVGMLLASCSSELEKISAEIHASRARVLERLVQLLSPDVLTGPLPAHGIACALPAESATLLEQDVQFYTNRKQPAVSEATDVVSKDFFFCPTAPFRLNKASIRFLAAGNELFQVNAAGAKETLVYSDGGKELPSATLWIAVDNPGISLQQTMFYFDIRNEADKNVFFHQLPKASWYINDQLLHVLPAYGEKEICGESLNVEAILNRESDVIGKIKERINAYYKNSFITLVDSEGHTKKGDTGLETPEIITDIFRGRELVQLDKHSLRWIEVRFPETISGNILKDCICIMNCFPVMNTRIHQMNYRLQDVINIIPLQTDDLFLDLAEVSDDDGKILNIRTMAAEEKDSIGLLMRQGGVGRFDERDAASIIDYILQLLRDDSAAFSTLGNDFINTEMKQLQQIMNKLEQRLHSRQVHMDAVPYLVIRNPTQLSWQHLFISYYSTHGLEANNIKAGTSLQLYKGGSVDGNQARLITTTIGGRNKLNTTEKVLAYRSALLSKDRIISAEDVRAFCHYQLGERVKNITVRNGVMLHPGEQRGFQKTIDVLIGIEKKVFVDMDESGELDFWTKNLAILLESKSSALIPYRVFIHQAT